MVNWDDIHRRLADAQTWLDLSWSPDAQETRRVLRERARALARAPAREALAEEWIEFLEFTLGEERYGIETRHVREVGSVMALTPVPCTPAFAAGLISLRGQILSVIDLRARFGLKEQGPADLGRVIMVDAEAMAVGVLATAIVGLQAVALQELETSLPTLSGRREQYLKGVSPTGVAIVDARKLLSDREIIVDADVEADSYMAGASARNGGEIGA